MTKKDYLKIFLIMIIGQLVGNFLYGFILGLLK